MKKFRIGFDLDDVVFDFRAGLIREYNKQFDDDLKDEDIKGWELTNYLKCTKEEIKNLFKTPGLFENLKPNPFMIELIKRLSETNLYEPILASAAPYGCYDAKVVSIKNNMPFLKKQNVIFAHSKSVIDVHILFDDGVHNIEDMMNDRFNSTIPVLVRTASNKIWEEENRGKCIIINNPKDSADIIHLMANIDNILRKTNNAIPNDEDVIDRWGILHYYLMQKIRLNLESEKERGIKRKFPKLAYRETIEVINDIGKWFEKEE